MSVQPDADPDLRCTAWLALGVATEPPGPNGGSCFARGLGVDDPIRVMHDAVDLARHRGAHVPVEDVAGHELGSAEERISEAAATTVDDKEEVALVDGHRRVGRLVARRAAERLGRGHRATPDVLGNVHARDDLVLGRATRQSAAGASLGDIRAVVAAGARHAGGAADLERRRHPVPALCEAGAPG